MFGVLMFNVIQVVYTWLSVDLEISKSITQLISLSIFLIFCPIQQLLGFQCQPPEPSRVIFIVEWIGHLDDTLILHVQYPLL